MIIISTSLELTNVSRGSDKVEQLLEDIDAMNVKTFNFRSSESFLKVDLVNNQLLLVYDMSKVQAGAFVGVLEIIDFEDKMTKYQV